MAPPRLSFSLSPLSSTFLSVFPPHTQPFRDRPKHRWSGSAAPCSSHPSSPLVPRLAQDAAVRSERDDLLPIQQSDVDTRGMSRCAGAQLLTAAALATGGLAGDANTAASIRDSTANVAGGAKCRPLLCLRLVAFPRSLGERGGESCCSLKKEKRSRRDRGRGGRKSLQGCRRN